MMPIYLKLNSIIAGDWRSLPLLRGVRGVLSNKIIDETKDNPI